MINKGRYNEDQIIQELNVDEYESLSENLKNLMYIAFGLVKPHEPVKCEAMDEYIKPDYVIAHAGRKKYISMKSGKSVIVHGEQISTFMEYLKSIGVSEETRNTIMMLHYRDGTINGTGKIVYPIEDFKIKIAKRIKAANLELNEDSDLLQEFANRVLFQGVRNDVPSVDAIYHGDYKSGVAVSKKQIKKHFDKGYWGFLENLHIGPFLIYVHPHDRDGTAKYPKHRTKVEISWPLIISDLAYIARKYDSYTPMNRRTYEE